MGAIREIFRAFAPEYLERFPDLPSQHRKVIEAILACRSGELGSTAYRCTGCGATHSVFRSCGNRHCPQCQIHKTRQWLATQLDRRLPGPHFFLTFTVPEPLRPFLRSHQRVGYAALFEASSGALKKLARDPRFLGTDLPGFTGVLHPWGRQLQFHPHIHYIAPAGGLCPDRERWLSSRADFYLPVRALSPIYRARFKDQMRREGLLDAIDPAVWKTAWNVHCESAGDGAHVLRYLAAYVFRVAISDRRIVSFSPADRTVTFRYRPREAGRELSPSGELTTTLDAMEFLRRFLQHVLPSGFMKVRHFGCLSPNCSVPLDEVRRLITEATGACLPPDEPEPPKPPAYHCPDCGAPLVYVRTLLPFQIELPRMLAIPDTG
jgi:hypothetical protein